MKLAITAARARNGVIGIGNELPWMLRDDMRLFRQRTLGHPVIMGRKTWESLGHPLPGRFNIVLSRQARLVAEGALVVPSFQAALDACSGAAKAFVIGGAELYRQALPHAHTLYLTEVDAEPEGDAHFPAFDPAPFAVVERVSFSSSLDNDYDFDVVTYRRREIAGR